MSVGSFSDRGRSRTVPRGAEEVRRRARQEVLVSVAIYGAIAGGLISGVLLAREGRLLSVLHEILIEHRPPTRGGTTAPYGVAIASGMYLTLILPGVLR